MARIYCRLRNVLICVCTPCMFMLLMVVYLTFSLYMVLNDSVEKMKNHNNGPLFVARGSNANGSYASLPGTFWEKEKAFWNQLQRAVDLSFNPILYPTRAKAESERVYLDDSFLDQSFSKLASIDSMKDKFEKLPEHMQHYSRSMQRRKYPILIQPDGACGAKAKHEEQTPLILFAIKSSELNIKNRQAIRQTWGQVGWVQGQKNSSNEEEEVGGYVRRVFLLGKENSQLSSLDLSDMLHAENRRYGDILQWDFEDTFFNLTLKDVLFWSWFSRSCGQTLFVFKGDDDVFVNTPKLISYLHEELKKPQARMTEFMVGDVIGNAMPIRSKTSKYFIPDSFYKGIYPSYAGGGGVVYSGQLARRLHHISKTVHLYPIDDVFVGMCMRRLNAHPVHHPAFLTFDFTKKEVEKPCSYHTILLVHKRSPEELLSLWADLKKTRTQCRDVPLRATGKPSRGVL
ncbi:N-acetyllactosaminide beta-1,3-N-acetylglucosaminyltransferase 2 [Oryzias melastigma]|uniref:Hexosyltransferase n=1 Tax=Oryzias melastigma TaxID=30732 RepID=A0A3B3CA87_ORYME|nr:N-acetyllactosaminide beta-1,3-N-acetylglucosaminyltransferase 2 [Oryzias melastigma]